MEIQKSFSTTTFGGFKKEEVTQYIDEIITKYDEQATSLKADLDYANSQIVELKSIIEEQYKKIVEINASSESLTEKNELNLKKVDELSTQLKPFADAQTEAKSIIDSARREAYEIDLKINQQLCEATEQVKSTYEQANIKAKSIIDPAQYKAETLVNSAREEAQSIIFAAKNQEKQILDQVNNQIEDTISLVRENENKANRLIEEAQKEAQNIIKNAKTEAENEKNHFESCLRSLETQKSKLLLSLDEIKCDVQAIQIVRAPKNEVEAFQALRQSTTEAIKKKLAMLNKEHQGVSFRD